MTDLFVFFVGTIAGIFAIGILAAALMLINSSLSRWLNRKLRLMRNGIIRLGGGVPWLDKDLLVLGNVSGQHQVMFVSRHHLAEGGLQCPLCGEQYPSGDFSMVHRTLVDGRDNEVIPCVGKRVVEGDREVPCGTLLAASPDTEHGDHLNDKGDVDAHAEDPPAYFRFVRTDAEQALREKWGVNATKGEGEEVVITEAVPANPGRKDDVIVGFNPLAPNAERLAAEMEAAKQGTAPVRVGDLTRMADDAAKHAPTAVVPAITPTDNPHGPQG